MQQIRRASDFSNSNGSEQYEVSVEKLPLSESPILEEL
jgi:hypothetical protein